MNVSFFIQSSLLSAWKMALSLMKLSMVQNYGSELRSFKDSLATIGVTVDVNFGQDLVARHLMLQG